MDAEQKKALIAAALAKKLREMLPQLSGLADSLAHDMVDGVEGQRDPSLWEVMAPLVDGLRGISAAERELRRFEGMPLTDQVIQEILAELARVFAAASGSEETKPPRSKVHRSTGVWGGGKMMPADYEKDRGGD